MRQHLTLPFLLGIRLPTCRRPAPDIGRLLPTASFLSPRGTFFLAAVITFLATRRTLNASGACVWPCMLMCIEHSETFSNSGRDLHRRFSFRFALLDPLYPRARGPREWHLLVMR